MTKDSVELAETLKASVRGATAGLVMRETVIELVTLGAVAREHVLLIGPPGTGKSEAVRRTAQAIGGRYFEYLLGRFTEPSEIFGAVDIGKLKDGVFETDTTNMLPEAEIAFLDEIFLGSTAILNTLLGILNERQFRRGQTVVACPLRVCVAAANRASDDEMLAAFADRFLLRYHLAPIPDPELENLLDSGWALEHETTIDQVPLATVDALHDKARAMDLRPLRPAIAHILRRLRAAGVVLSDRRMVKLLRIVSAAAVLAGREQPATTDLWPVVYAVPEEDDQHQVRELLSDLLADAENRTLTHAPLEAARGAAARAVRIAEVATDLFAAPPAEDNVNAREAWQLRLEGVAREIDAGFTEEALPAELRIIRERIAATLDQTL